MSAVIDEQCKVTAARGSEITNEELKVFFDVVASELIKNDLKYDFDLLTTIINAIDEVDKDEYSNDPVLNTHSLFLTFRECIIFLLQCWSNGDKLRESAENFLLIVISFLPYSRQLFFHQELIDGVSTCLEKIATSELHRQDSIIRFNNELLGRFQLLIQGDLSAQENPILTSLFNVVYKCLCIPSYAEMLDHVDKAKKLTDTQAFFFVVCPHFMNTYEGMVHKSLVVHLARELVKVYTPWLAGWLNQRSSMNKTVLLIINRLRRLTTPRANIGWVDIFLTETSNETYLKLVDYHKELLEFLLELKTHEKVDTSLIAGILQSLFMSTMKPNIFAYIQNQNLVPLLFKIVDINDALIQFHGYRFLAKIITEDDIKALANPARIATVFANFVNNDIDNQIQQKRLHNTLLSLKSKLLIVHCSDIFLLIYVA